MIYFQTCVKIARERRAGQKENIVSMTWKLRQNNEKVKKL